MIGTLCYRHGYLSQGCLNCAHLWKEMATTTTPNWADKIIWPDLGLLSDSDSKRQYQALLDGALIYGWGVDSPLSIL